MSIIYQVANFMLLCSVVTKRTDGYYWELWSWPRLKA